MKGDGETDSMLSPNDEFANYEQWDKDSFGPTLHTTELRLWNWKRPERQQWTIPDQKSSCGKMR